MAKSFSTYVAPRLDRLRLAPEVRAATDRQLIKMTGAELSSIGGLEPSQRTAVHAAIDESFVSTFRLLMLGTAGLAFASAFAGAAIASRKSSLRLGQ
jgi:hypothetical protein